MGLEVTKVKDGSVVTATTEKYEADRKLWLTTDGDVVEDGDPKAAFLCLTPGKTIPLAEAQEKGLVAEGKKQRKAPPNKQKDAPPNKTKEPGPEPNPEPNPEVVEPIEPPKEEPPAPEPLPDPPPKVGKGSGRDAWATYAEKIGIETEGKNRAELFEAVDKAQAAAAG